VGKGAGTEVPQAGDLQRLAWEVRRVIGIENQWKSATDRSKWAARGASLVAKVKATKVVWFPPKPEETGKRAASTATRTAKKTTSATARKTTNGTKRATKVAARKKA
jgi:hypothetical protein